MVDIWRRTCFESSPSKRGAKKKPRFFGGSALRPTPRGKGIGGRRFLCEFVGGARSRGLALSLRISEVWAHDEHSEPERQAVTWGPGASQFSQAANKKISCKYQSVFFFFFLFFSFCFCFKHPLVFVRAGFLCTRHWKTTQSSHLVKPIILSCERERERVALLRTPPKSWLKLEALLFFLQEREVVFVEKGILGLGKTSGVTTGS